ncbi:MAG: hypothetical protein KDJ52_01315 [Anaerolineae bacterium]|nr:hypothetical protein [Anaerolineae bacterium]
MPEQKQLYDLHDHTLSFTLRGASLSRLVEIAMQSNQRDKLELRPAATPDERRIEAALKKLRRQF